MQNFRSRLGLIVGVSLLVSVVLFFCYSGAYVRVTFSDHYTYWIGPVSTTIPFAFWALVTLGVAAMGRKWPGHLRATSYGYVIGWLAMTALALWIVSLPKGPESSSTMAIAIMLTPMLFAPLFPIFFLLGYFISKFFGSRNMTDKSERHPGSCGPLGAAPSP
ncbi:MAG: hypothetical protein V4719_04420 [Planctomycetota bacterium]